MVGWYSYIAYTILRNKSVQLNLLTRTLVRPPWQWVENTKWYPPPPPPPPPPPSNHPHPPLPDPHPTPHPHTIPRHSTSCQYDYETTHKMSYYNILQVYIHYITRPESSWHRAATMVTYVYPTHTKALSLVNWVNIPRNVGAHPNHSGCQCMTRTTRPWTIHRCIDYGAWLEYRSHTWHNQLSNRKGHAIM